MKKGRKIGSVSINCGRVTAYDDHNEPIPLTRSQRNTLADYESPDYIENIRKEFSHKEPLSKYFYVIVDDSIEFRLED